MRNTKISRIPKNEFPLLVKQCLDNMDKVPPKNVSNEMSAVKRNLISGFEACGLIPFNPDRVLRKFPDDTAENTETEITNNLKEFLRNQRYNTATRSQSQRKKMLRVEPRKSVTAPATQDSSSEKEENVIVELNDEDQQNDISSGGDEPLQNIEPTLDNVVINTFVLVKFLGGTRKKNRISFRLPHQKCFGR